jgi:hypothetical protein
MNDEDIYLDLKRRVDQLKAKRNKKKKIMPMLVGLLIGASAGLSLEVPIKNTMGLTLMFGGFGYWIAELKDKE